MSVVLVETVEGGKFPIRATNGSAGTDLYAREVRWDSAFGVWRCPLGVKLQIADGYYGLLLPRSSVFKAGAWLANGCGLIDSDYRGELVAMFYGDKPCEPGERCAQLVIQKDVRAEYVITGKVATTQRNEGGFGSTGNK